MRTNVFEAIVEGPGRVRVGRARLIVPAWRGIGKRVRISIRPTDVILSLDHPGRTSARNILPGHVDRVRLFADAAFVRVAVGFTLSVRVTRAAVSGLRLRKGTPIFALLKATAIEREEPAWEGRIETRVRARGRRDWIEAERLDFLEEVARSGSIAAAGRSFDVTYRTAWLWVDEANRAWGRPLVARVTSGGTGLTAEGARLLERVREARR